MNYDDEMLRNINKITDEYVKAVFGDVGHKSEEPAPVQIPWTPRDINILHMFGINP